MLHDFNIGRRHLNVGLVLASLQVERRLFFLQLDLDLVALLPHKVQRVLGFPDLALDVFKLCSLVGVLFLLLDSLEFFIVGQLVPRVHYLSAQGFGLH